MYIWTLSGGRCDPVSGACSCSAGWRGALCDDPCPPGTHGANCTSSCLCQNQAGTSSNVNVTVKLFGRNQVFQYWLMKYFSKPTLLELSLTRATVIPSPDGATVRWAGRAMCVRTPARPGPFTLTARKSATVIMEQFATMSMANVIVFPDLKAIR